MTEIEFGSHNGVKFTNLVLPQYNCCGIDDKSDWYEASLSSAYIPHSCCDKVRSIENCTEQEVGNKIGCLPRIKDLRNYQLTFILINAVIGAFLVVSIINSQIKFSKAIF